MKSPPSTRERPRRVAIVCDAVAPWHKGGRETILQQLAPRLVHEMQAVDVYTMKWWDEPARSITMEGVTYHALCARRPLYRDGRRSMGQAVIFALSIFKLLGARFDVLHVDSMPFFPLYAARVVAWVKRRRMTSIWLEVWGRAYWRAYAGPVAGQVGYTIEHFAAHLPDAIVSISHSTTDRLRNAGVTGPLTTLTLGVDHAAIAAAPAAMRTCDAIYVGRLIEHKGVDLFLRALARLKARRGHATAIIVGDGPEKRALETLCSTLGLTADVAFVGEAADNTEVYSLMKSAQMLALPSRREGFGLVVVEANAAGVPVVTLDHPDNAARDLIRPGVNGFLACDDPEDFALKMDEILRTRAHMRPREGVERFDWDAVARQCDALFWETKPVENSP